MPRMLKTRVRITDKKERQRRLEITAHASKGCYAKVGVLNASDAYPGQDRTVGQVAADMEFGTERVPSRSFLRTPVDNAMGEINSLRETLVEEIIAGRLAIADALQQLGFFMSNRIKNTIYQGIKPELRPSTRAAKRTERKNKGVSPTPDTPLMDTGTLVSKVGYEVVLKSRLF